ncbi:MAG: DUF192 domain-containing protein [Gemmatimonadota bacterium]|nr:DUF192 domain-containing protein [Gemmatimonadota bacterium]
MAVLKVVNETRGTTLGDRVELADGWWSRLRGLLGRTRLEPGSGLLLVPSRGVHMYGMSFSIDVAFLDDEGVVVALYPGLSPWSRTPFHPDARAALELPSGTLSESGTQIGDRLKWTSSGAD